MKAETYQKDSRKKKIYTQKRDDGFYNVIVETEIFSGYYKISTFLNEFYVEYKDALFTFYAENSKAIENGWVDINR